MPIKKNINRIQKAIIQVSETGGVEFPNFALEFYEHNTV